MGAPGALSVCGGKRDDGSLCLGIGGKVNREKAARADDVSSVSIRLGRVGGVKVCCAGPGPTGTEAGAARVRQGVEKASNR
jgi:hypothetical protein